MTYYQAFKMPCLSRYTFTVNGICYYTYDNCKAIRTPVKRGELYYYCLMLDNSSKKEWVPINEIKAYGNHLISTHSPLLDVIITDSHTLDKIPSELLNKSA